MCVDFLKEAEALLDRCSEVEIASVNNQGYPRVCVVSKLANEGFKTIYFSTGTSGTKAHHFMNNKKASACFHDANDSVTLVGNMEIIEDLEEKKSVWQDWLINHFAGGVEDKEYCLLKFTADEATFWINREFTTRKL